MQLPPYGESCSRVGRMFSIDLEGHASSWPCAQCQRTRPQRVPATLVWRRARWVAYNRRPNGLADLLAWFGDLAAGLSCNRLVFDQQSQQRVENFVALADIALDIQHPVAA